MRAATVIGRSRPDDQQHAGDQRQQADHHIGDPPATGRVWSENAQQKPDRPGHEVDAEQESQHLETRPRPGQRHDPDRQREDAGDARQGGTPSPISSRPKAPSAKCDGGGAFGNGIGLRQGTVAARRMSNPPPPRMTPRAPRSPCQGKADTCVGALAHMFAAPADDPFAPELIANPFAAWGAVSPIFNHAHLGTTPGRADGVCANVTFSQPHRLVTEAVAATAAGVAPDEDPWPAQRSLWQLLEMIEARACTSRGCRRCAPTRRRPAPRAAAARNDRRSLRPLRAAAAGLLRAKALGEDRSDRPPIRPWQPRLWRALRARIGVPSAAERLRRARL